MQKVDIIRVAKKAKKVLKSITQNEKNFVSYSRRIERIKTNKRICAMTFDDGPTRENALTDTLLDILNKYSAKGTFDVIGTTENNYPDIEGKISTPSWSGVKFDHYPSFNKDTLAGAVNCPDIIERIIKEGHEITNHTYSHILFGKKNIIYSKRETLKSYDEVFEDVKKLHSQLKERHNYEMHFSRPPHYVDKINGGFSSYDVYSQIGYNYLAASFDGAGWLPCESEEKEVAAMTEPLEKALKENPDALAGQIIFQKDGYNMALRATVTKGLEKQLQILKKYGYEVVTVSELLVESPFLDIGREDTDFELFNKIQSQRAVAYKNNALLPDKVMTRGELAMLLAKKTESIDKRIELIKARATLPYSLKPTHPYSSAMLWAIDNSVLALINNKAYPDKLLCFDDIKNLQPYIDIESLKHKDLTRRNILKSLIIN